MGYIYKITNNINEKIYIGQTSYSLDKRFKEHCKDAFRNQNEKRPLYSAMRKYGIENFHIELIEETDDLNEREKYWIAFYEGYSQGYNATKGGDGKCLYDHNLILEKLKEHPYPCDVANEIGCCRDIVRDIAKANGIEVKTKSCEIMKDRLSKRISAYTKDGKYVVTFSSTAEAAKWCFENKKCSTLSSGVRSHISEAANGKRKSAYGYIWKYEN